jgi:hypothetical protein
MARDRPASDIAQAVAQLHQAREQQDVALIHLAEAIQLSHQVRILLAEAFGDSSADLAQQARTHGARSLERMLDVRAAIAVTDLGGYARRIAPGISWAESGQNRPVPPGEALLDLVKRPRDRRQARRAALNNVGDLRDLANDASRDFSTFKSLLEPPVATGSYQGRPMVNSARNPAPHAPPGDVLMTIVASAFFLGEVGARFSRLVSRCRRLGSAAPAARSTSLEKDDQT